MNMFPMGLDAGSDAIRALDALVREGLIGQFEASDPLTVPPVPPAPSVIDA